MAASDNTNVNALTNWLERFLPGFKMHRLAGPIIIIMILSMMILPLPPLALDILFTFNIALSMFVLLVSLYTLRPLEFAIFPTVLLMTTLLRLSLNVASTRVVLLEGHTGPDAAGKVIEAFGHFLVGGNFAIGIIVFVILVVINFVVVTKGSGRIAEVAARFTLDAMPGKQMAIDADLNAGLIAEDEARKRRKEVSQEADFYGAMDGASKFVRGDAVAGILIMLLNIIGGLLIGMMQHNLDASTAVKTYTLLTIGDGLVAQIPALIISTAAGMMVSRVSTDQDLSQQLIGQLSNNPQALYITGVVLALLGLIPNMPHVAFLLIAGLLGGGGWLLSRAPKVVVPEATAVSTMETAPADMPVPEVSWDDVVPVDPVGLDVGYRLIVLVDHNQGGELLKRIRGIRKKTAQDLGFLVPSVHIRDNLELRPNQYRITLRGVEVGRGEAIVGQFLAINPGRVLGPLVGQEATDPAFGLPAVWINAEQRDQAQAFGYTVVDASTVVATHLSRILQTHAPELLGREETQALVDRVAKEAPKLVEDLIPKVVPLAILQKVLQNLLTEGMHIRDMRTIIETLAEYLPKISDADELTSYTRQALSRAIVEQIFGSVAELPVIALEPQLEQLLLQTVQGTSKGIETPGLEPNLAEKLLTQANQVAQQQEQLGLPAVLLVPGPLRGLLAKFLRRAAPQLKVIAHTEIPDNKTIKVVSVLGAA